MIYLYSRGVELGIITHFSSCPFLSEVLNEAMWHNFGIKGKVLVVESKKSIRKRLGVSPDHFTR